MRKPNQNAFTEGFNLTVRDEVLNLYLFRDLDEVREIVCRLLVEYNELRMRRVAYLPVSTKPEMSETLLLNVYLMGMLSMRLYRINTSKKNWKLNCDHDKKYCR